MIRRRAIGLISTFIAGCFFEQLVQGIQQILQPQQIDLIIIQGTPEQVATTEIAHQQVAGWLIVTYPQGVELLARQNRPLVTISCRAAPTIPAVLPDNAGGIAAALEHLLAQGHTQIAFVGDTAIGDIDERRAAWEAGLRQRGLQPGPLVVCAGPLAAQGVTAARQLLEQRDAWSAVIAGNDWAAIGLLRELQASGCRVPDDVAVIGFDDISEAQVCQPPLATIRQHGDSLGATAATLLLGQIAGEPQPCEVRIPTLFVPRASAGRTDLAPLIRSAPLAQELIRVLLPASSMGATASPDLVWPEVDQLVRLLEAALAGDLAHAQQRDSVAALFATPLLLNASAETLVELRRVLATVASAASAEAADQAEALLDLLLVEALRSYRRRQNMARRTLSEVLHSQYRISERLLSAAPQQLEWLSETGLDAGCLALWAAAPAGAAPALSVAGVLPRAAHGLRPGALLGAGAFPPLDLAPAPAATWLVLPVRTADHDWGLLAVSGAVVSSDPWLEDSTINLLEISSGWLGSALEREALRESLRAATAYEQLLQERLDALLGQLDRPAPQMIP